MRARVASAVFLFVLGAVTILAPLRPQTPNGAEPASRIGAHASAALKITFGEKSAVWTPAELAALPHTTVNVYNEHAKANQTYSGAPLIDLLARLGVAEKPRGRQLRLYVVAEGSDGYEVVYSIGEVTPDIHEGVVIVADRENGETLKGNGPFQLVATDEKRPARWVRNLVALRVMTAR